MSVRHTLEDYSKWKPYFDALSDARKEYGCTATSVFASVENPNDVLLEIIWENKEGAMQFMNDPGFKARMGKAGVIGIPGFSFVE